MKYIRNALSVVLASLLAVTFLSPVSAAVAAEQYLSYTTYASAPNEIIGKTTKGLQKLTPEEAATVPKSAITVRTAQFMRSSADGSYYKVVYETVTPISEQEWKSEGAPTPRVVDRVPKLEYYTYASNPSELLVRSPLGVWRQAKPSELTGVPEWQITRRTQTFFIRNVGETQMYKKSAGVTVPITDAQWRGEGSPTPMVPDVPVVGGNPFQAHTPYVDPGYPSVAAAASLRTAGRTADAAQLDKISLHAGSLWLGDWNSLSTVKNTTSTYVQAAVTTGQTGILVLYGIPGRDCDGHSAGGFSAPDYRKWVDQVAAGINGKRVAVVVEPDALLQLGRCPDKEGDRTGLLRYAAEKIHAAGGTVYLDAGSSYSVKPVDMAARLLAAGVSGVRGFSTNVSNFKSTEEVRGYADEVSRLLGGKKYVIDTSRNGNGSNGEWCNARGRALGAIPGASSYGNQDANLWIKTVGRSDGTCNGGPIAGEWWNEIALEMARNSSIPASSESPTAMITTWNVGLDNCATITVPVTGNVNATVDWGDGTTERITTGFPSHEYEGAAGTRTVTVDGSFDTWVGSGTAPWDPACVTRVTRWGDTGTTSAAFGFAGAQNLIDIAEIPKSVTDYSYLFTGNLTFTQDISGWDVSKVTSMAGMFEGAENYNRPLAGWNVSSVRDMSSMFAGATSFNQPLRSWVPSALEDASGMFERATSFNQEIGSWPTGKLRNASGMFRDATVFNQPLKTWSTTSLTDISGMFERATSFKQNLSVWDTSQVVSMSRTFAGLPAYNQPLNTWNVARVVDFSGMFDGATTFDQGLSSWNVSSAVDMTAMFRDARAFNKNLSGWNVTRVTEYSDFAGGAGLTAGNQPRF